MIDVRNRELAEVAQIDDFVVSNKLVSLMLAQASENEHLEEIFKDLLDEEGSEICLRPAADYVRLGETLSFYEVTEAARQRGEVAIGHHVPAAASADDARRMGGIVINPPRRSRSPTRPTTGSWSWPATSVLGRKLVGGRGGAGGGGRLCAGGEVGGGGVGGQEGGGGGGVGGGWECGGGSRTEGDLRCGGAFCGGGGGRGGGGGGGMIGGSGTGRDAVGMSPGGGGGERGRESLLEARRKWSGDREYRLPGVEVDPARGVDWFGNTAVAGIIGGICGGVFVFSGGGGGRGGEGRVTGAAGWIRIGGGGGRFMRLVGGRGGGEGGA